ncbi:hypothetical protein B0H14DRAFT_3571865 [Mycena olivaceomarginata]|nr:hypothetical protein B0H14DRAFT_3571865 [Mycena olivaceomarginata]
MPWADDVSGNRSKQYNAYMNMYIANINLPHQLLSQEYFVRFCATSQYASSLEQFDALAEDCMQKDWTSTYNCKLQQEILFRIRIHLLPADNPQQAEITSTAGSSANLWCREDDSGGLATYRETEEGYHALFATKLQPGKPRTPADTVAEIKEQIRSACLGVVSVVENLQTESGVKDKISQKRVYNRETRDPRLNDPKIKNEACQLVKQGIINQIQEELFDRVIMQPLEHYEKLDEQTHILVLILNYVRAIIIMFSFAFAVSILIATALVKSYTLCFSEKINMSDMERFKHQVSGGWWKPVDGDWTQAGRKIQTFLTGNQQLQRCIGWTSHDAYKAGSVMPVSKGKQRPDTWKNALGSAWNDILAEPISHANKNWIACKYAVARSQEPCFTGSWVFILDGVEVLAARIIKILIPEHTQLHTAAVIVLQIFTVSETVDDHYGMPLLVKTENTVVSRPDHILFKFNAQHDCHHFSCPLADSPGPQQEQSESKLTRKVRAHKDESRFLLNTHTLHNSHLVRETLPRSLTAPKPCFVDRRAKHSEFAATLQAVGPEKRAQATARGQATKARNKQDKVDKAAGVAVRAGDPATNIE